MRKILINGQNYKFRFAKFSFASKLYVLTQMKPEEIEALAHALLEVEGQNILIESDEEASTDNTTTEKA